MRLVRLETENYKGIRAIDISPGAGVTEISGPNGSGKSSTLESIQVWLDGLRVAPAEPIRKGAERARIRGGLGEMYVTRVIERKKGGGHTTKILFESVEGKPYTGTQKQLDDLIGEHHLDPLDFLALDSKGKFEAFQVFVPGFDFAKSARESAADFERRTTVNRMAKEARAAAGLILVPEGTPSDPIDEQALVVELQRAGEQNTEIERRRQRRQAMSDRIVMLRSKASTANSTIERTTREIEAARDRELQRIENQILALQRQASDMRAEYDAKIVNEGESILETAKADMKEADESQAKLDAAESLPEIIDTAALSQRIQQARQTNQAVAATHVRAKHVSTAERYEAESKALTEAMTARQTAKEQAIASGKLPIDGLEFGDNEILLHGVPFEQASTAQKLRAAVAYSLARNPKLRLVWIKDASLLDDKSYAEIQKLAAEYQCDIYLETVRAIGKDAIVLSDGALVSTEVQADSADAPSNGSNHAEGGATTGNQSIQQDCLSSPPS